MPFASRRGWMRGGGVGATSSLIEGRGLLLRVRRPCTNFVDFIVRLLVGSVEVDGWVPTLGAGALPTLGDGALSTLGDGALASMFDNCRIAFVCLILMLAFFDNFEFNSLTNSAAAMIVLSASDSDGVEQWAG